MNEFLYTNEYLTEQAIFNKSYARALPSLLKVPVELRADVMAESIYTMNMTAVRKDEAIEMAIRTVLAHGGRPAKRVM